MKFVTRTNGVFEHDLKASDVKHLPYPYNMLVLARVLPLAKKYPPLSDAGIASFNSALRSCLEYQVRRSYEGYSEDAIEDAVKTADRAYLILTSHYQDGKTLTQLGKELGISTSRVGQLMHMNERRIKLFKFHIEGRSRVPENLKVLARHLLLFTKPYE